MPLLVGKASGPVASTLAQPGDWRDCLGLSWTTEPAAQSSAQSASLAAPRGMWWEKRGMGTQEVWVSRFSQDQLGDLGPVFDFPAFWSVRKGQLQGPLGFESM